MARLTARVGRAEEVHFGTDPGRNRVGAWLDPARRTRGVADITGRTRLDRRDLALRFADVQGSTGWDRFRVSAGYLYSDTNPYAYYDTATVPASYFTPRNELTLSAAGNFGEYRFSGYARRDLHLNKMDSVGVRGTYENECFIFDVNLSRRYTSLNGDNGATYLLFQVTLKTVGQVGFNAN